MLFGRVDIKVTTQNIRNKRVHCLQLWPRVWKSTQLNSELAGVMDAERKKNGGTAVEAKQFKHVFLRYMNSVCLMLHLTKNERFKCHLMYCILQRVIPAPYSKSLTLFVLHIIPKKYLAYTRSIGRYNTLCKWKVCLPPCGDWWYYNLKSKSMPAYSQLASNIYFFLPDVFPHGNRTLNVYQGLGG